MSDITSKLREDVVFRAGNRCEYCQLSQVGQAATFHIDHVHPRSVGGATALDNLALACVSCSLRKSAKQFAIDADTGVNVPLFNPRAQPWHEHFRWDNELVIPLSAIGRATVDALALNRFLIVAIRTEEAARGRHPP